MLNSRLIDRRSVTRCILISSLLLVAGCNTPHQLADTGSIRTIGIVASVPETVYLHYQGWLDAASETADVPWAFNKAVAGRAAALLQSRFTVKVASTTVRVRDVSELESLTGSGGSMVADVAAAVKPGDYDAVLVITGGSGCSVVYAAGLAQARAYLALGYRLTLFDGKTLKVLATRNVEVSSSNIRGTDNPFMDIDFGWRGERFAAIPDARKQRIHDVAFELIAEGLKFSLPRLGLAL